MSISLINDFHSKIYQILSMDDAIKSKVDKIYIAVTQDAKYPFIFINMVNVINLSRRSCSMYEIEFEISIFARQSQTAMTALANLIDIKLALMYKEIINYALISMRFLSIQFARGQDLLTNKMIMNYKSVIREHVK